MGVSGSQYDVTVRLSTQGADQLASGTGKAAEAMNLLQQRLDAAAESGKRASASFTGLDEAGNKFSVRMSELSSSTGKYTPLVDQLSGALAKLAIAWAGLSVVRDLTADMFDAVKAHEDMVTTMVATMTATNGWSDSVAIASGQLERLKETAALVNVSESDMVTTFTMLKRTFGGTSDEAVTLTEKLALLARQSGTTVDQLANQLARESMTGVAQMRGTAGIAIATAGIDPQTLMTMKDAGLAMEYLNATIADNPELVARLKDQWSYLTAEFAKNKEQALETVGLGLEPLKQALKDLNAALSSGESQAAFNTMGANLRILNEQFLSLLPSAQSGSQATLNFGSNILKGLNIFVADIILITKELNVGVGALWDVLTSPDKYFGPDGKARLQITLDAVTQLYQDNEAKIQKIRFGLAANVLDTDVAPPQPAEAPTKPASPNPLLVQRRVQAFQAFQDQVSKFLASSDTSGLSGLDLALAKDEEKWSSNAASIDSWVDKWEKADPKVKAIAEYFRVYLASVNDASLALAQTKDFDLYAQKFQDALSKMDAVASNDTALDKVQATWESNLQKITTDYTAALQALGKAPTLDIFDPASTAAFADYYANLGKLDESFTAAKQRNDAQRALNDKKILAEQHGDYEGYYAAITELDQNVGMTLFQAHQDAAAKSAKMLEARAVTAEQGYAAGLAIILGSIKSFGQDVATLTTSLWSNMTTAFDTGFYDVLSGKFSDLKNVLSSLWDSILKDFSKLLTQILERWILTGEAMGSGQGQGGILGGLFSGSLGGSNAVSTPGGTSVNTPYDWSATSTGGSAPGSEGFQTTPGSTPGGGGIGGIAGTIGNVAAVAGIGYGLYQAGSAAFSSNQTSQPTYQDQNVPYQGSYGGPGMAPFVAAATTVAASALAAAAIAASLTATIPVVGWIAAAVILIVGAIIDIFNGPSDEHVKVSIADAMSKNGASTVIGGFVDQIIGATTDFVGSLAARAGANVSQYTAAYQAAFQEAYGKATFDIHAGSAADLQKDVQNFFSTVLPTLAMKAAFGQTGYGMGGNSTTGIAGVAWNANNPALMDQNGNWVKQQLYDPNAPIPMMLTGLGVTAGRIGEIATMLASGEDIKTFEQYLQDFVGVIVDLGTLSQKFGQTTAEWFAALKTAEQQQGTAAQFGTQITNLQNEGIPLDSMSATDQLALAKQLVTDSQTLLGTLAQALQSIMDMIASIQTSTAASITSYQNKLLTSAQIESNARASEASDMAAITAAANPTAVQAAWQQTMTDIGTVLDAIVARIQAIWALQASYATFETTMATNAGPQFATDPTSWLAQNQAAINAITTTLKTATGSDAVTDAQTLLTLVQDRYNNELSMLANVKAAIQSIDAASQSAIQNLTMQGMGSVVNGTWTPDVHAQGDYLNQQYNSLMGELGTATTSDQVTSIMSQINSVISQLASQAQDPNNYAASRQILISMQEQAQKEADTLLGTMKDTLTADLKGIGDQLKAGETALSGALTAAQTDFTTQIGLMGTASGTATTALTGFANGLATAMQQLDLYIAHWEFVMANPSGAADPNWNPKTNTPYSQADVWSEPLDSEPTQVCLSGPDKGQTRPNPNYVAPKGGKAPGTGIGPGAGGPGTQPNEPIPPPLTAFATTAPVNVTVTVNSGTPEDVAAAAASAAYDQTLRIVRGNNVALVRALRNNPSLLGAS